MTDFEQKVLDATKSNDWLACLHIAGNIYPHMKSRDIVMNGKYHAIQAILGKLVKSGYIVKKIDTYCKFTPAEILERK